VELFQRAQELASYVKKKPTVTGGHGGIFKQAIKIQDDSQYTFHRWLKPGS